MWVSHRPEEEACGVGVGSHCPVEGGSCRWREAAVGGGSDIMIDYRMHYSYTLINIIDQII